MTASTHRTVWLCGALALLSVGLLSASLAASTPLTAGQPIIVPGGAGGFDWMRVDTRSRRLFATHKGTKSLAILDLKTEKPLPSPGVGTAQGVGIDEADRKIFLGDEEEHKVVVLDYATLKLKSEIPVSGPVDDLLYCPANGMVYADKDDGTEVWVINAKTEKLVTSIHIPEAPEKIEYDRTSNRIYQNIKSNNTVQVINPSTNKVEKSWDTAPATGPHGLAIDERGQRLFTAGSNGKLVALDLKSGRSLGSVDIVPGVDQIAFDPGNKRIYCACREAVSVAEETAAGLRFIANVPTPPRAHTLTVDPQTHAVWTCYADKQNSYLLKLTP